MKSVTATRKPGPGTSFAIELESSVTSVLNHATDAHKHGIKIYQSLQNLNDVIGAEYGNRVLYELIQNAHDAHPAGERGRISVRLVVHSDSEGTLFVANGGNGFRSQDIDAIKNIAISSKEVGEGIGNKGLGFRSIEALTNDVHIYSRNGTDTKRYFDGYTFRFAKVEEIELLLRPIQSDRAIRHEVARAIPRYLVPIPLDEQPQEITAFAQRGYATVVAAPLRSSQAIDLDLSELSARPRILALSRQETSTPSV